MITMDSITIQAPADIITDYDESMFKENKGETDLCTDEVLTPSMLKLKLSPLVGLNMINISPSRNTVRMQFSAKVLLDNYYDLINKNTIEQAFDTIHKTTGLHTDLSRINEWDLQKVDFTKNIKGNYKPNEYIDNIRLIINGKYNVVDYKGADWNRKVKSGITFMNKATSFKERIIVYDKHTEIGKDKRFKESLNNQLAVMNQFHNVARIECNVTSFKKIRELTGTSNNLVDVLNSTLNPPYKLFNKIKGKEYVQTDLFDLLSEQKLYQIEKLKGRQGIITELNYDEGLIRDFLKLAINGNPSRYVREYMNILNAMQRVDRDEETDNKIMSEFEQLLKAA